MSSKAALWLFASALVAACGNPKVVGGERPGEPSAGGAPVPGMPGPGRPGFTLPPASAGSPADAAPPPASGTCAAEVRQAGRLPVDLLFLVDKSQSMDLEVGTAGRQWDLVREALMKFVADPRSAELGVGLQLFPLVPKNIACTSNADCALNEPCQATRAHCSETGRPCTGAGQPCSPASAGDICTPIPPVCHSRGFAQCDGNYADPVVPVAALPAGREPFATRLIYTEPAGQTPIGPAVRGGLAYLRARQQAGGGRRSAVVLATDGYPVGCSEAIPQIAALAAAGLQDAPPIPTFVIGVFSGDLGLAQATFDQLARAGGTGEAIILEPNADLSMRFLAALEKIRETVLPCEFAIPPPQGGAIDFGRVNLRWKGAATMEDVLYVERAERCDPARGGWYYDVPPAQGTPSRVVVCEATCQRFKAEQAATVELSFGCQTRTIE